LNLAGMLFGLGCLMCALFLAGTFFIYTVPSILLLMAALPALAALRFARLKLNPEPVIERPPWRDAWRDFRNPAAVLFALLLFFQFGNEGALSGWLALFLTQRLGVSPASSLVLLAWYWVALLVSRVVVQSLLRRVSHAKLLGGGVLVPMFACLVLFFTNNLFGATLAVLLAGGGFAVILPLVMERMGTRFPSFHPAFLSGIFGLALTGGLLAPASLGPLANTFGIGVVAGLPLLGSIMVAVLLLLIALEAKFNAA
jgi:fucose permease